MVLLAPPQAKNGGSPAAQQAVLIPFSRAADEHIEQFVDTSVVLGANSQAIGPFDVPAYGFMRSILILVEATGGVNGAATVDGQPDAPWSLLSDVQLTDVSQSAIVGPFDGYSLYLLNKYSGLYGRTSPRNLPTFSAVAEGAAALGNFSFSLRFPVEVGNRDALGSLANQNASSTYKLRMTIGSTASIYATSLDTTAPTVRVRAYLEAWTQPAPGDQLGAPQATFPPAHNTTQYWSQTVATLSSGQQSIRHPRVGNYIRNLIYVYRSAGGVRQSVDSSWPDPATLSYDTRPLNILQRQIWRQYVAERFALYGPREAAGGLGNSATDFRLTTTPAGGTYAPGVGVSQVYVDSLDAGVFPYDFMHEFDGRGGQELRDGWLPTVQSTRLELAGNFGTAGSLTILTNDVSPAGSVFV